jgi:hypothetical protein
MYYFPRRLKPSATSTKANTQRVSVVWGSYSFMNPFKGKD